MLATIKRMIPKRVFYVLQPIYHFALSFLAALLHGFPSKRLIVIGVTGTKGKTTVVELAHEILTETGDGVASTSSLRFRIKDQETLNDRKMTMPGRFFVQRFLRDAVRAGCKYVVIEVTSEGIRQYRHRFIDFDTAVLTNISPEHIESHGGFEPYVRAKLDLFWRVGPEGSVVINRDSPFAARFRAAARARLVEYGREGIERRGKHWNTRDIAITQEDIAFDLQGTPVRSPLLGEFNFYNILAAAAIGSTYHVPPVKIARAVGRTQDVPGRMEFIQHKPFAVVIDYAHTPDSLKNVYKFLKGTITDHDRAKLICVLGAAGGGRDKWKRPEFGCIAASYCDDIILTNEDPYDEDPKEIMRDIEQGVPKPRKVRKIMDRTHAIREAIKSANKGDVVVVTGKGVEPWMMVMDGKKVPWNEREVIQKIFKKVTR